MINDHCPDSWATTGVFMIIAFPPTLLQFSVILRPHHESTNHVDNASIKYLISSSSLLSRTGKLHGSLSCFLVSTKISWRQAQQLKIFLWWLYNRQEQKILSLIIDILTFCNFCVNFMCILSCVISSTAVLGLNPNVALALKNCHSWIKDQSVQSPCSYPWLVWT